MKLFKILSFLKISNSWKNSNWTASRAGQWLHSLLPAPVKRRIKALKNLQHKHMELECAFHKEFHLLELKYEALKADLEKVSFILF